MREIILGTAGHVDHGKTSLIRALTGIETDRLKEEKERGITIELGFAFLDLPCGHRLGIVDVPGHERFVKNMVAGAAGMDLVAFVVAADEGIMPQTMEHYEICRLLGLQRGLIIITKIDMVEPDWLELVKEEVAEYFAGTFLAEAPMVAVSATTGQGLDEVRTVLDQLVAASTFTEAHGPFRLPVDRIFTMKGFGAVITGTSISGRIRVGDDIMLYPQKFTGKIRGIQVHARAVEEVEAGHRTALNIQGIEKERLARGNVVATPDCLQPSYLLDADFLYIAANKKPLKNRSRVRFHLGTAEVPGRIVLLEDEELLPGAQAHVQLLLEEPVAVWPGDRYVARSYSPVTTIGGGGVLNNSPRKRRRFKAVNQEAFQIYQTGSPQELVMLHLRESGLSGLTFNKLAIKTGLFGNSLKKVLNTPLSARKILVIEADRQRLLEAGLYQQLADQAREVLGLYHQENPLRAGLVKEELRSRLSRHLDQRLFQFILNDLLKQGLLVQEEGLLRLATHQPALKADEKSLHRQMEDFYSQAGLAVPTVKELQAKFAALPQGMVREVLEVLVREKRLVRINVDLYVHAVALTELEKKVVEFIKKEGEIDAPRFKNLTGLTRKYSIPLLEYFDNIKVTIRVGDKRLLR